MALYYIYLCMYNVRVSPRRLRGTLRDMGEFECISLDGTYKVCMSLAGQPTHGKRARVVGEVDTRESTELHVVVTSMSKSGCIIDAVPMFSEGPRGIVRHVARSLGVGKNDVKVLKSDRAPDFDNEHGFKALGGLEGVLADPVHPSLNLEKCSACRVTNASLHLRKAMKKFSVPSSEARPVYYTFRTRLTHRFEHSRMRSEGCHYHSYTICVAVCYMVIFHHAVLCTHDRYTNTKMARYVCTLLDLLRLR